MMTNHQTGIQRRDRSLSQDSDDTMSVPGTPSARSAAMSPTMKKNHQTTAATVSSTRSPSSPRKGTTRVSNDSTTGDFAATVPAASPGKHTTAGGGGSAAGLVRAWRGRLILTLLVLVWLFTTATIQQRYFASVAVVDDKEKMTLRAPDFRSGRSGSSTTSGGSPGAVLRNRKTRIPTGRIVDASAAAATTNKNNIQALLTSSQQQNQNHSHRTASASQQTAIDADADTGGSATLGSSGQEKRASSKRQGSNDDSQTALARQQAGRGGGALQQAPQQHVPQPQQKAAQQQQQQQQSASPPPMYAYAFVITGCHPEESMSYRFYIYNVLVATKLLRERGTVADVVTFVQMAHNSSYKELPPNEAAFFSKMHIDLEYIPKSANENFYHSQISKFRVLGLTKYRRVLFMDSDIMPVGSLDYLFTMSDGPNAILKDNIIMQGLFEPANGGFFLLSPSKEDYHLANDIVQRREKYARDNPYPFFDEVKGWGHEIVPPDQWEAIKQHGTNWTFLAAYADQGLLYHWTKYVKKSVSIIMHNGNVQNWGINASSPTGGNNNATVVALLETLEKPFLNASAPIKCFERFQCNSPPKSDYIHFTGRGKPWLHGPPPNMTLAGKLNSKAHLWYYELSILNEKLGMNLNYSRWELRKRPKHGMFPTYVMAKDAYSDLLEGKILAS